MSDTRGVRNVKRLMRTPRQDEIDFRRHQDWFQSQQIQYHTGGPITTPNGIAVDENPPSYVIPKRVWKGLE